MAELKTQENDASVDDFIASVADDKKRQDCATISELMQKLTKAEPKMWGSSIVGFGRYHYKYASGREGEWFFCWFFSAQTKSNSVHYVRLRFLR